MTESVTAVIRHIERAFAGVTLGSGTGWYEAAALDGGGTGLEAALARDERDDWHALFLNPEWTEGSQSELYFMDAEGLRFHLPATMILSLQTGGMAVLSSMLTLFIPPDQSADDREIQDWSALNDEQRACVAAFLRVSAEAEEIQLRAWAEAEGVHDLASIEKSEWREAYESYWWRYDRKEGPPTLA